MKKTFFIFMFTLYCIAVSAQKTMLSPAIKQELIKQTTNKQAKSLFTPGGFSNISSFISQISLTAQQKDKKANLDLDFKNKSNTTIFHFGASQTISEGTTEVTPFNLEGISNGTAISIGLSHLFWKPKMTMEQLVNFEAVRKKHFSDLGQTDQPLLMKDQLFLLFTDAEKEALTKSYTPSHPTRFILNYKLEKNSFDFVTDSLALNTVTEVKYSHKFTAGVIQFIKTEGPIQQLLSFSISLSTNFNAGDNLSLLIPFGNTINYYTKEVTFGPPKKKTSEIIALEYRIVANKDKQNTFALSPSINFSVQKKLLAFQLPIFFIRGKDSDNKISGLQGGIRLGYLTSTEKGKASSFKKGFSAEIMITEPFDIFK